VPLHDWKDERVVRRHPGRTLSGICSLSLLGDFARRDGADASGSPLENGQAGNQRRSRLVEFVSVRAGAYFFFNSASIALMTAASFGSVFGSKRPTT
jgi:hypothetical protein